MKVSDTPLARSASLNSRVEVYEVDGVHVLRKGRRSKAEQSGIDFLHRERVATTFVSHLRTINGTPVAASLLDSGHDYIHIQFIESAKPLSGSEFFRSSIERRDALACRLAAALVAVHCHHGPNWPAILEVATTSPTRVDALRDMSSGSEALLTRLHGQSDVVRAYADVGTRLRDGRVLVHGDLKADNVLVKVDGTVVIVDWETAGRGRIESDIAALLGSLLFTAVLFAIRDEGQSLQAALSNAAGAAFRFVRVVLAHHSQPVEAEFLVRATGSAVLTRLQGLLETTGQWDKTAEVCWRMAQRLLLSPEMAVRKLFR